MAAMEKSPDAFRTISEVADWLGVPTHVLRFWESRFTQVKPVKRAGGRRYYRPSDMELIGGIKRLLHDDGMTIRGVQKLLREKGVKHVASFSPPLYDDAAGALESGAVEARHAPAPEPEEAVEEAAFAEAEPDEAMEEPLLVAPEPEPEPLPDFGGPTEPEAEPEEEFEAEVAELSALDGELDGEPVHAPEEAPEPAENVIPLAPVTDEPATGRESLAAGDLFDRPFVPAHLADAEDEEEEDDALLAPELSIASRLKIAVAHHDVAGHAARLSEAQVRLLALRARMDGRD
jgi:DNA-binding transcriptional MerR regulator